MIKKIWKTFIIWSCNSLFQGTHFFKIKRRLLNTCQGVFIGKNTRIVTPIHMPNLSELTIGEDCWINRDFTLEGNGKVIIGNNCDLAPQITVATGSHEIGDKTRRAGIGYSKTVVIGDGCWIGIRSTILPDIRIGDGVMIAAGSTVVKNIDCNTLAGGVPAKIIRKLD